MLRAEFEATVNKMLPGEALVYHTGDLWNDTRHGVACLAVQNVAKAAWDAMEAGKVHLVQRRLGDWLYDYCAVKKRCADYTKTVWTGCYDTRSHAMKLKKAA